MKFNRATDVVHLRGLRTVKMVKLRNPAVNEECLEFLASLPHLEWVRLEGPFTDRIVGTLSQLQHCRTVGLIDSQVTESGLEELTAALPHTNVVHRASGE